MQVPGGNCLIVADSPKGRVEIAEVFRTAEYGALPVNENSSLILAAPELFEAVKQAYEVFINVGWEIERGGAAVLALAAAIRSAEGGKS
jgi:hypothetical protein